MRGQAGIGLLTRAHEPGPGTQRHTGFHCYRHDASLPGPNVVGMSAANADKAIQSARLVPYNRKNAAGIALVRSQSPAAGTILTCGGGVSYDAEIFMPKPFPVVIPGTIQTAPPTNTIK